MHALVLEGISLLAFLQFNQIMLLFDCFSIAFSGSSRCQETDQQVRTKVGAENLESKDLTESNL